MSDEEDTYSQHSDKRGREDSRLSNTAGEDEVDLKGYEEYDEAPRVLQLDGLVLLKIIKHCKENVPEVVTGQLLGLNVEDRLEVTNCFPFPSTDDNDENDDYQLEMMKCLRTVNVDNNTVGWYQSAFLGSFINSSIVEAQYTYQKEIPSSVVVVYDPFRTAKGSLALHAYRLTDSFMAMFAKRDFSQPSFAKFDVSAGDILEEVPIKVHNSHLVHGFLYELREDKSMSCEFDRLTIGANPFLEKNLGILSDCIDEYSQEQGKFQYYQRQVTRQKANIKTHQDKRKIESDARVASGLPPLTNEDTSKNSIYKPINRPSRLDTYLISNQIAHYCEQINSSSSQAFQKLYVAEALIKEN
jgi:translation initiation factor 3 subunit H